MKFHLQVKPSEQRCWLTLSLSKVKGLYSLKVAIFVFAGKWHPTKTRLEALVFSICENMLVVQ